MRRNRSSLLWLCILIFFWAFLPGCQESTSPRTFRIGFSQCCDDPWRDVMEQEMYRELAFHPELDFEIRVANNNSDTQIEQIRELLRTGIDLLIVSPNESKPLTPIVDEVFRSGIPVILIDRKTESERYTAYIGADNYEIGATAANYLASQFNGEAKVIELQLGMTMTPAQGRSRGFRDVLVEFPGIEVLAQIEMTVGMEELKTAFLEALRQYPEAQAIFAHNDYLAENAYRWAQNVGREDELFFMGIDGIPGLGKGIQAVEDGVLDASLLYPTGGSEAIQLALAILNNLPYDKNNTLQTIVINKSNARILHLQMKKVEILQRSIDGQLEAIEDLNNIYLNQRAYIFILVFSLVLAIVSGGVLLKWLKAKEGMNRNLEAKNREVLEQQQQIVAMSEELKKATKAKMDFFTNISHEFRTPLTLILGYIEGMLSRSGAGWKANQQDLGMVRKNALRLLRLINQLMDFSKTESGKMAVRATENDLVAFTREIVEAYRKIADKRNVELGFFAVEKALPVWFDINMMDKVLFNLLSNAFKFTPDGGRIQLAVVKDPIADKAIVKVEDNGRGMSEEEAERAFEQFYQAGPHRSRGTGLGLSLSKELVELHSGDITVWSEPGKGTRFEITLPLGYAHFNENQKATGKPGSLSYDELIFLEEENQEAVVLTGPITDSENTLLIIEDNEDLRLFLKGHFGQSFKVMEAPGGNTGLDIALEEVPDLIIADIMMPGRDGLALTRILKTDLRTSHIPIVLLTAQNTMEQKIEGIQTGADAYVTKPFNLAFLSEVIKNLLHSRKVLKDRFSGVIQPNQLPSGMGDMDEQFLRKFTQYVESHYDNQGLTVESLSEAFGLSRVQLYRKVKALLGESVNDYIQHVRLKKASQLLLQGGLTVAEIAYKVGYSSPGYFSTAFKGKYACSPSEYREKKNNTQFS